MQKVTEDEFDLDFKPHAGGFKIRIWLYSCSLEDIPPAGIVVLDVRDLQDGPENPTRIWRRIDLGLEIVKRHYGVATKCAAGISRSTSIAAAILALREGSDYRGALEVVKKKCPRAYPNPLILDSVQSALEIYAGRTKYIPFTDTPVHKHP